MRKLTLNLEALRVESFRPSDEGSARGTVIAHLDTVALGLPDELPDDGSSATRRFSECYSQCWTPCC